MVRRIGIFLLLAAASAAIGAAIAPRLLAGASAGVLFAALVALFFRPIGDVRAIARAAAERERAWVTQKEELQERVDVLSAEREISLIVNEDVDFRTILDRVLAITCDTLGGDVELWMNDNRRLVPRAVRRGTVTEFDLEEREDLRVRQCYETGCLVFEAEEGRFHALAPLQADREIIGVVRVSTTLAESSAAREQRAKRLGAHLPEFSKFLALALKTPDLYTRAVQDGLTGLWTKRHFFTEARTAMEAAGRYGEPLSLIMVDVDHFKKVNDTHGHVTGDKVLKGVAEILRKKIRSGSAFRYGGEEMAVLLPKAGVEGALEVAERLRRAIEAHKIAGVKVTASFGVAGFDAALADPAGFVEKADAALYQAKESGRNRVVAAPAASPARPDRVRSGPWPDSKSSPRWSPRGISPRPSRS